MVEALRKIRRKYLLKNWRRVFWRSYCLRAVGIIAIVAGSAAMALPFAAPIVPNEYLVAFCLVIFMLAVIAGLARLVNQGIGGDDGD